VKTHVEFLSPAGPVSPEVNEASVMAVPIPINRSEAEIGAVLTAIDQEKIKVRMALMGKGSKNKKSTGDSMDLLLKKMVRESGNEPRAIYLVHDMSATPLFDLTHEPQQQRIREWLEKEKESRAGVLSEIHLFHSSGQIRIA
jgi:hypothetical protein